MKARIPGANNGQSQAAMLKQVQKMQEDMANLQADLEQREYTAEAGGGIVEVALNGKHEMTKIKINMEEIDVDDIEMLEDFITIAVNGAVKKIAETQESEMSAITGGINIPGLF